jgi:hypothetical protein
VPTVRSETGVANISIESRGWRGLNLAVKRGAIFHYTLKK